MHKLALVLGLALPSLARAEMPHLSVETDPALLLQNGYGFSIGGSAAPHWHVQITEFAADLYGFATPSGWHARIERGSFLWAKYYLDPDNRGLFAGAAFAALDWRYTRSDTPGAEAAQDQYAVMPFIGYRWFPADTGLFVQPWAGLGLPFQTVGSAMVGANKYDARLPVFPLAAVHVGWEFGR